MKSILFFFWMVVAVSALDAFAQDRLPGIPLNGVILAPPMLEKLKTEAIDGSPDAAIQVERHVAMIQGPSKEALKWALIAAENGSVDGEYTVGFILRYDPDADSRRRALFWLRRASTHGLQAAKNLLLEIERKKGSGSLLKK